jgi:hypothetical protein
MSSWSTETWKLGFEILGICAVAVSVICGAIALFLGNKINHAQAIELRQLNRGVADAQTELAKQQMRAARAEQDTADAKKAASDADAKAEGFRLDIAKANERAALANQKAEEERLARVRIEERMKPRSFKPSPEAISALKAYKGTEYTFLSVFGDEESIVLLRQLDGILLSAGWTRVKPPHAYPAINVYGQDQDFAVASGLSSNIKISVDSEIPLATLQAIPVAQLPAPVGAAVALAMELTASLVPPQEGGVKANVETGKSMIVRIEIGRKP